MKALAENKQNCKLLAFRSDRGGEFNSVEFSGFCEENGVRHYTTAPYTPQQNGVVERRNQTVVEMERCLLKSMAVPGPYWGGGGEYSGLPAEPSALEKPQRRHPV